MQNSVSRPLVTALQSTEVQRVGEWPWTPVSKYSPCTSHFRFVQKKKNGVRIDDEYFNFSSYYDNK